MSQTIIRSRSNPAIKRLRLLKSPGTRRKSSTFIIEGPKFVNDAITAGFPLVTLVVSERYRGTLPQTGPSTRILRMSGQLFKEISDAPSPQGVIAEAEKRWFKIGQLTVSKKHLIVAWGVQDPGNIGTLVRSCAAFEMGGMVVGGGSADPFSPKAVRASAGSVLGFHLAQASQLGKLVEALRRDGYMTCWMGAQAPATLRSIRRTNPKAVFIGSEGRGFSDKEQRTIGEGFRISVAPDVESLNAGVAGSIAAYELSGQDRKI